MNKEIIFSSFERNQTVFLDDNKFQFFFFGCWNQNRIATNDIILRANSEEFCKFGVVCGDNVYPIKTNDTKISKVEDIVEGFNILKTYNGNVYIGLGNHEVDSTEICKSLFDEKTHANQNLIMPNNYYSINIKNRTTDTLLSKIIILDTNILESNLCYGEYDPVKENEMIQWLKSELLLCENLTPIIMGHYPFFYFKQNKKTFEHTFQFNYTMEKIYNELINYVKPVYYLCADIHNYQHIITSNITQHIVGTGGAIQDKVLEVDTIFTIPYEYLDVKQPFHVVKCVQKYGYLLVDIENNIITGEFKPSDVSVNIKDIIVKNKEKNKENPKV